MLRRTVVIELSRGAGPGMRPPLPAPWGYAHSADGLDRTKHKDPVVAGFYGGDPSLKKIGANYYAWHSRTHRGHLRIYCRSSPDMIHWEETDNHPQLGYTQPWERGIGRPEVYWDRHLADAELLEHAGKVIMLYGGAQCPLGVAVFDGTFAQLAARLMMEAMKGLKDANPPSSVR